MVLFRHVASVAIINADNQVLAQDRKTISKYGEEWSFFGGGIDEGETPLEAAVRELREELHLEIDETELHFIGTFTHDMEGRDYIRDLFVYRTENHEKDFLDREGA